MGQCWKIPQKFTSLKSALWSRSRSRKLKNNQIRSSPEKRLSILWILTRSLSNIVNYWDTTIVSKFYQNCIKIPQTQGRPISSRVERSYQQIVHSSTGNGSHPFRSGNRMQIHKSSTCSFNDSWILLHIPTVSILTTSNRGMTERFLSRIGLYHQSRTRSNR